MGNYHLKITQRAFALRLKVLPSCSYDSRAIFHNKVEEKNIQLLIIRKLRQDYKLWWRSIRNIYGMDTEMGGHTHEVLN